MKRSFSALAALAVVLAAPAASAASNIGSDRGLGAALPPSTIYWPHSAQLTLTDSTSPAAPVTIEADPFPFDDVWQPVATGVQPGTTESPTVLDVRPDRNTRYRVRDDRGRVVVVDLTFDLLKRLRHHVRCLSGETSICTRGLVQRTITLLVRGPDADVRPRRLRLAFYTSDGDRLIRIRKYRLRRIGQNRWRVRARVRHKIDRSPAISLTEPRRDAFGETPSVPGYDQTFF